MKKSNCKIIDILPKRKARVLFNGSLAMVIIQVVMDTWAKLLLKLDMISFHLIKEDKVFLKEEGTFTKVKK